MDPSILPYIIILVILLALSAFFSSAETALTTVSKIRIKTLAEEGNKKANIVLKIKDNPEKMLSAILIGNNIVNISASSLATIMVQRFIGDWFISIATGILTILVLIFGEITPKTVATNSADSLSMVYARPIWLLMTILTPIIFLVNVMASGFMMLLGIKNDSKANTFTEEELRTIMDVSHEEGVIEEEEREMINNVFDLGEAEAKDIMIPRIDMCMVDVNATYEDVIEIFRENRYTRLPVYQDTTDNVIGIINVKDLILYRHGDDFNIKDYLRNVYYTYEYKNLSELLSKMREDSVNITIVLDEYGAAVGLITMEDLLEEIVGDIKDEYDYDEEDTLIEVGPYEYIADGLAKLDDINSRLNLSLVSEDYDSISGYIIGSLERLPNEGDKVEDEKATIIVDSMDKNRIDKVHIYLKSDSNDDVTEDESENIEEN